MIALKIALTLRILFTPFGNELLLTGHNRTLQKRLISFKRQGRLQKPPALRFYLLQLTKRVDFQFVQWKAGFTAIFEILLDTSGRSIQPIAKEGQQHQELGLRFAIGGGGGKN